MSDPSPRQPRRPAKGKSKPKSPTAPPGANLNGRVYSSGMLEREIAAGSTVTPVPEAPDPAVGAAAARRAARRWAKEQRTAERTAREALLRQGEQILSGLITNYARRLDDPDFRATPGDLVGTLQAMERMDGFARRQKRLFRLLSSARKELGRLNDDLFSRVGPLPR